jgi:hypothetical protein
MGDKILVFAMRGKSYLTPPTTLEPSTDTILDDPTVSE